jgi:transglutaminase-like putative cysteine protease/type II secretory pathway pseudopilin PulG
MASKRRAELAPLALAALSAAAALSLARVFSSGDFIAPIVGAALLAHTLGWFARRRHLGVVPTVAYAVIGLAVYVVWVFAGSTTSYGVPGADTWHTLGDRFSEGWHVFRAGKAPVPPTDGPVLLAVLATGVLASIADLLAFRRRATVGALVPPLCLFVLAATLGTSELRVRTAMGFAAAAILFLLLQHDALLAQRRAWFSGRRLATGTGLLGVGMTAGLVAVVAGAVVAPALPGTDSGPLLDYRALGRHHTGAGGDGYVDNATPLLRLNENFLSQPRQELFRVRARGKGAGVAYWRVIGLDRYNARDQDWELDARDAGATTEGLHGGTNSRSLHQQYTITNGGLANRWMPAAYRPVRISRDGVLVVNASDSLVSDTKSLRGLTYTVDSDVVPQGDLLTAPQRAAANGPAAEAREYTALPGDFSPRIRQRALAVVAAANATRPYEKARALENYFISGGFIYSLDADVSGNLQASDAMERFLFDTKTGFCVQFAGTYAAMARAVGLPARVAVGFTPGTAHGDVWTVTNKEAHAWPEVYLGGMGWVPFEPTPNSPLAGGSNFASHPFPAGVGPPGGPGTSTPASTPATTPSASVPPSAPVSPGATVQVKAPTASDTGGVSTQWLALLALPAALLLAAVGLAAFVLATKARRRRDRRARADATAAVAGAWEQALERLGEAGIETRPSFTPLELAASTARTTPPTVSNPLHSLATTYTEVRYSTDGATNTTVLDAWSEVEALDTALDEGLGFRGRWRRRLDTRALRWRD